MEFHGSSNEGWIVVPPAYPETGVTFGPFTREEARAFTARRGGGDYAVNLRDLPRWFNV